MQNFLLVCLGLLTGTFSGLIGVGGGIILVPVLSYGFGLSQSMAQGTTLAVLIPPVSLLAVFAYYQKGLIDFKIALLVSLGFFIGGFFGGKLAVNMSNTVLAKIFGIVLMLCGFKMLFK